jgi:hypothetical protein
MQHPLGTQEEKFFYKLTFCAFRNSIKHGALRADGSIRKTMTISISKENIMKNLKVMLLMAVIALDLAGAASAAQAGCCASEDCCASCSGSC